MVVDRGTATNFRFIFLQLLSEGETYGGRVPFLESTS